MRSADKTKKTYFNVFVRQWGGSLQHCITADPGQTAAVTALRARRPDIFVQARPGWQTLQFCTAATLRHAGHKKGEGIGPKFGPGC